MTDITYARKCIVALALELPSSVHDHVASVFYRVLDELEVARRTLPAVQADANRALETYRERLAELSAAVASNKLATDEMRTALSWLYASIAAGEIDIVHDDGCPEDDTCDCAVAATTDQLQRAANLCGVTYASISKTAAKKERDDEE